MVLRFHTTKGQSWDIVLSVYRESGDLARYVSSEEKGRTLSLVFNTSRTNTTQYGRRRSTGY